MSRSVRELALEIEVKELKRQLMLEQQGKGMYSIEPVMRPNPLPPIDMPSPLLPLQRVAHWKVDINSEGNYCFTGRALSSAGEIEFGHYLSPDAVADHISDHGEVLSLLGTLHEQMMQMMAHELQKKWKMS